MRSSLNQLGRSMVFLAGVVAFFLMVPGCAVIAVVEDAKNRREEKNRQETFDYAFSPTMRKTMLQLAVAQEKTFSLQRSACDLPYKFTPINIFIAAPIKFAEGAAHPIKGLWKARYELERCGASKVYNALFSVKNAAEPPAYQAYYPGVTNASALLVQDALQMAILQTAMRLPEVIECTDVDIFDMRVTVPIHDTVESGGALKNVWSERWTLRSNRSDPVSAGLNLWQ